MSSGTVEQRSLLEALDIADVRAAPGLARTLAGWLHDEWYRHRGEVLEQVQARLLADHTNRFPASFVAQRQGEPVGMFTLGPALHPRTGLPLFCLSNVFVDPAWRGCGIGRRLCEAAVEQTRRWRIPRLSLFTTSHGPYYAALGWLFADILPMRSRGQYGLAILMRHDVRLLPLVHE